MEFNYPKSGDCFIDELDLKDEFIHGWCHILQYFLYQKLEGAEMYEIFDRTLKETDYEADHCVIKYKGFFIDARGCFTEEEMLNIHKEEYKKYQKESFRDEFLELYKCTEEEWFSIDSFLAQFENIDREEEGIKQMGEDCLPIKCAKFMVEQILVQIADI